VVLLFFLVPIYASSSGGRKMILARINRVVNGKTNFATLSMGWFKGLELTDFSFINNEGTTSVAVKRIFTRPRYLSIVTGTPALGLTILDEPVVNVKIIKPAGLESKQSAPSGQKTAVKKAGLPIERVDLVVNNGGVNVKIDSNDTQARSIQLRQIDSTVKLRPPGQTTVFDANLSVAENDKESQLRTAGQLEPGSKSWAAQTLSGDFTIEVNELDLATLGPLFALAGVDVHSQGKVSANISTGLQNGTLTKLQGKVDGTDLDITAPQLKGDRFATKNLTVRIDSHAEKEMINIDTLEIKTDWLNVTATGTVPKTIRSAADFIKPDSADNLKASFECDLAKAMSQMPHTFGLKETAEVTAGRLTGNISTSVEKTRKIITGKATLWVLEGKFPIKTILLSRPIRLDTRLVSDKAGINIEKLTVDSAFASAECSGKIDALDYTANLDLAKMQSEFGQYIDIDYTAVGKLTAAGTAAISKDAVILLGSSTVKNLKITSPNGVTAYEPSAAISYDAGVDIKQSVLNVNSLNLDASFGQIGLADSTIPLGKDAVKPIALSISADVDLQKVQTFTELFAVVPEKLGLAGRLQSKQFKLLGRDQDIQLLTDATEIRNLKITYPNQVPFEQDPVTLVCDIVIDPTKKNFSELLKSVNTFELITPEIKITKVAKSQTTKAGQTKLSAEAQAEYDLATVSSLAEKFLPEQLKMKGRRKDTIKLESQYPAGQADEILANMTAKTTFGFESAEFMGLNFSPAQTDIKIEKGLLSIAPFSAMVNKGQFNLPTVAADFKQKPTLLETAEPAHIMKDVQIDDRTTTRLLKYLNPIFAGAVNVSGTANLHCEKLVLPLAEAGKNDTQIIGTVSMYDVKLQGGDLLAQLISLFGQRMHTANITVHPTRFVLQNGRLSYDDMQIDIGDNPVNFAGTIGLDQQLNMEVTLPYTFAGTTARTGQADTDRITLPLKGTLEKPELDFEKFLKQQGQKIIEEQLRKGLEKLFE